jgi:hypothetical protein
LDRDLPLAVLPKVALLADAQLGWFEDLEILGLDLADDSIELLTRLPDQLGSVRELQQGGTRKRDPKKRHPFF